MSISIYQLYDLFFKSDLVEILPSPAAKPVREITQTSTKTGKYTPITQKLLEYADTKDKDRLLADLEADDKQLGLLSRKELLDDPDFIEKLGYSALGFYMETYLCFHGCCPKCKKKSLRKFKDCNIPAIDFVCINQHHIENNECFLFQLKVSVESNYFDAMHIKVGSRRYGNLSHSIKGTSDVYHKKLLIGYICLKLNDAGDNKYLINKKSSYCYVPDLKLTKDELYYEYLNEKDDVIKVNINMMESIEINDFFQTEIVDNQSFNEIPITNTYFKLYDWLPMTAEKGQYDSLRVPKNLGPLFEEKKGGYYDKYLKYKSKYLKLKSELLLPNH